MFWLIIGLMLAAAIAFVALPLYRTQKGLSVTSLVSVVAMAAVAAAVYSRVGSPGLESAASAEQQLPGVGEVTESLAARLAENPEDLAGWKLLGRSYIQLGNAAGAIRALERAVELESGQNGQTLADLGEAVLLGDGRSLTGRAGQLFENALALAPNNPKALFYAGLVAVERGDAELGVRRWEALLATSPPPNVADILRQRIAALKGAGTEIPPAPEAGAPSGGITARISLGETAKAAGLPNAIVFVIARDPGQPVPPIAAVRRQLSDLPADVTISDSDAMMAGRVPSAFDRLEIIARVSLSGQPGAQTGDWFGSAIVDGTPDSTIEITINEQVP